jgi:riboflavin kinase/FMN adenylyltransferase
MIIYTEKHLAMERPTAVTIGKFDGLHLGHMALIRRTLFFAERLSLQSLVFTFNTYPSAVLAGRSPIPLMSWEQKSAELAALGVDILFNCPFDREFAAIPPEGFCRIVFDNLKCRALVVGRNFRFGKGRAGSAELLKQQGESRGAIVEIMDSVCIDGEPVSSTRIREAISSGDTALAERLLGRRL